jgi:outer membrane protein OmpA-like peptidoglycan-associated protein
VWLFSDFDKNLIMKRLSIFVLLFCVAFCTYAQTPLESLRTMRNGIGVQNIRYSPDGKYLASIDVSGYVSLWDVETGAMKWRQLGHPTGGGTEVTFNKTGKMLASSGGDGSANVWDVMSGRRISVHYSKPFVFATGERKVSVSFVVFSPDSRFIYFAGDPGYVMKAQIGTNDPGTAVFSTNFDDTKWYATVTGGTISADERFLVLTVGSLVEFIDLQTYQLGKYIRYPDSDLNDVVNGPFLHSVTTWSYDGKVSFWDINSLQKINAFTVAVPNEYSAASFSKDARLMVTSAAGTTARVWDLSNGRLTQTLTGHTQVVRLSRFSPTKNQIATASYDGTIQIWGEKPKEEPKTPIDERPDDPLVKNNQKDTVVVVKRDTVVVIKEVVKRDTIRITDKPVEPVKPKESVVFEGEVVKVGETVRLKNIQFEQSKDVILKPSYGELNKVLNLMKENPTMMVEISGHTDNVGDANENYKLSEKRVIAVRKYLSDGGIEPNRIRPVAYGDRKPIADNRNEKGRRTNRRVEFKILKM